VNECSTHHTDTVSFPVGTPLDDIERTVILRTLRKTDNNKTRAAELLRISLKTLHNKLRLYRDRGLLSVEEDRHTILPLREHRNGEQK